MPGLDIGETTPHGARVYDALLGGSDNFGPDQELAAELAGTAGYPGAAGLMRANRRFVLAATAWAAHQGVRQFLDVGCGFPVRPAVHATARAIQPDAVTVYADNDAEVIECCRAVHAGPGVAVIAGDAGDPAAVLADPGLREVIDLARPVCVILGLVLNHLGRDEARNAVAGFTGPLAAGSLAVISLACCEDQTLGGRLEALTASAGNWRNRSLADVESFFAAGDLRLVHGRAGDVARWPVVPFAMPPAAVIGGVGIRR